ncbi:hypothetical protein NHQ30_003115 [Ciborinia camelliae]|nr:hypothetical protein NHQ30_003115 [Ciborinia camelliae]
MAPVLITEDYYMILEVVQTATSDQVVQSYRRLAKKLHPDRNTSHDATEAFQLLGRAYETLKDESKRRDYDVIYPSIKRSSPSPQATQTPHTRRSEALSEAAQIAALQKSKQERGTRWQTTKYLFELPIFKLQADIRRLEQEINNLDSIVAAEAAKIAQENSWGTWLLSPIYKKVKETEEEKERKDRERQERRIEKDMKERRLVLKKGDLKNKERLLRKAKEDVDAADLVDDRKITDIQCKIWAREERERQERERLERERMARERQEREKIERERLEKIWKQEQQQREKQEREAAEALRKQEEENRKWQKIIDDRTKIHREQYAHQNLPEFSFTAEGSTYQTSTSNCRHGDWWSKVQGRTACPKCNEVWTYLLQCPGCKMKACPRCQGIIRPRIVRSTARTNRRAPPRVRTPSPVFWNTYDHDY